MKWVAVSGSWKYNFSLLRKDIEREIAGLLDRGCLIVSGGAPGVDYWATEVALKMYPDGSRIRVYIPTSLDIYIENVRSVEPDDPRISSDTFLRLIEQLLRLKALGALTENDKEKKVDTESYHKRNLMVVKNSDSLIAFHVNNSGGVLNTIEHARSLNMKVTVFNYTRQNTSPNDSV